MEGPDKHPLPRGHREGVEILIGVRPAPACAAKEIPQLDNLKITYKQQQTKKWGNTET